MQPVKQDGQCEPMLLLWVALGAHPPAYARVENRGVCKQRAR